MSPTPTALPATKPIVLLSAGVWLSLNSNELYNVQDAGRWESSSRSFLPINIFLGEEGGEEDSDLVVIASTRTLRSVFR